MRILSLMTVMMISVLAAGCSSSFWGGGAAGVVGTGAGYEYHADQELRRIKKDLDEGRIDQKEYETRKDQIERMSVIK